VQIDERRTMVHLRRPLATAVVSVAVAAAGAGVATGCRDVWSPVAIPLAPASAAAATTAARPLAASVAPTPEVVSVARPALPPTTEPLTAPLAAAARQRGRVAIVDPREGVRAPAAGEPDESFVGQAAQRARGRRDFQGEDRFHAAGQT
jgi:hypothetical protein